MITRVSLAGRGLGRRLKSTAAALADAAPTPSSTAPNASSVDPAHWDELGSWDAAKLQSDSDSHLMASWVAGSVFRNVPMLSHGEHVYLFDKKGNKYLDWTSQAVCTNLGYDVPPQVVDAVTQQLNDLPMSYGGMGNTEIRVRLGKLLSELLPGDINGFLFPSGGSEANEAAIRIARRFTGRSKIINFYRSYHGGSPGGLQATGDFRRDFVEGTGPVPGFIKTFNPLDPHGTFNFGATDEDKAANALAYLEDQILMEGAESVAAVMFEPIIGSGGVYVAPAGYMEGVREICDKYGILFIADEVMVGFGRTGTFWGFQNYEGVVPDIVTSAKGLSGAYLPLSMVAVRDHIKEHFETTALGWGATYHAHPVSMACAYECVKFMLEKELVAHAKNEIEPVMKAGIDELTAKYEFVGDEGRYIGAFGCMDLLGKDGKRVQDLSGANCTAPDAVATFRQALRDNGVYGLLRPPLFHCAPPLVISGDELAEGFRSVDKALGAYNEAVSRA